MVCMSVVWLVRAVRLGTVSGCEGIKKAVVRQQSALFSAVFVGRPCVRTAGRSGKKETPASGILLLLPEG